MKTKKIYFMDCFLAARKFHDADEVWSELKVGTVLHLERDFDNRHDPCAVAVFYKKTCGEAFLLGYIPRKENETIAKFLEMGWNSVFECRISKIDEKEHPEHQVHLAIKILRNL